MAETLDNFSDLELSEDEPDSLDGQFSLAANHLKSLVSKLDNKKLLQLYSYYKQGTEGPCNVQRPKWFDAQGKMKWDAWHSLGDLPSNVAKQTYISLIKELEPSFGSKSKGCRNETSWAAVSTLAGEEESIAETDKTILDYCREGRADCVANILEASPEANDYCDCDGLFPIHWASDRGHNDVVKVLLSRLGESIVEQTDASGQTALHYAAACGHIDVVRTLLAAGASNTRRDHDGDSPLDLATDADIRKLLQEP